MEYNPGKHQLIHLTLHLGFTLTQGCLKGGGAVGHNFWAHCLRYSRAVRWHLSDTTLIAQGACQINLRLCNEELKINSNNPWKRGTLVNRMDKLKWYTTEACLQSPPHWGDLCMSPGMNAQFGYLEARVRSLAGSLDGTKEKEGGTTLLLW